MAEVTQEQKDQAAKEIAESTRQACNKHGHSLESLLKDLKKERSWKETKTMKVKGVVDPASLPPGHKIIAVSGVPLLAANGNAVLGADGQPVLKDGETVIMWQEKAGGIRQKARMDAHSLRGDYPADKHVFPDKDGNPQNLTEASNLETAARLLDLINKAMERKGAIGCGTEDK
jgi:hypothetical protein